MTKYNFPLLTIGNAIVDVITHTDDEFLQTHDISKGTMNLVDRSRSEYLYSLMEDRIELSGGSAANTAVAFSALGGQAAYLGKVADDELGKVFRESIRSSGVHYDTAPLVDSLPTARSMIFVTPDSQRSMNTYLGATVRLSEDDVNSDLVAATQIVYFEGYLWDSPQAKKALIRVADIAHSHGAKIAISLSDRLCVERFRTEFLDLMKTRKVDIVFCNAQEAMTLYETDDFARSLDSLRADIPLAVITRDADGSLAIAGEETAQIDAEPATIVDTTGAGDYYAAGFLFGLIENWSLPECIKLGGLTATYIIERIGAAPQESLASLVRQVKE